MCGITAILSPRKPVGVEALNAGIASLHHRGPDGRGSRISSDGTVALGHARLSIIDLETGDQPIVNEDESIWIVANGEFYFRRYSHRSGVAGTSVLDPIRQ